MRHYVNLHSNSFSDMTEFSYPNYSKLQHKYLHVKGRLQWKNDLGLYFSLVLVMKIGMCDLVIFRLV